MIDEHEWKYVLQAANEGTFSAAAKRLFVSQPSLSQSIKKIEGEIGLPLFDRSQTPLQLTAAGEIYVRKAREMQRIYHELVQETADLTGLKTGTLIIGSSRTRSSCYLTQPIIEFHRRYPGIRLMVKEHSVSELKTTVAAGEVDFALLYEPLESSFERIPLLKEKTLLALPPHHPFAQKYKRTDGEPYPTMSFARMHGQPFIRLQENRRMSQLYSDLCMKTQCRPDVVFEANSIIDAAELCAAGMGATLVTDMVVNNGRWSEPPCFFNLEEAVEDRQLVVAFGKNKHLSQAARKFIELLQGE
ncbi:putative LysR family transcriptional regulator [Selenomonas ruminantium subsp. lactilytica TAM6421]|uniref:Putative LysR family transcriptional regulator n=1 Tax=Selenomonas ruminantium subsp. lactilytica (strain NBRC 103574 / TAM6421) TaxID=927704 RepID=I0GRU4_SELRL|nr:LysR family transcriptional regulator [Selenomonas ruminantium]BAL83481.1 putative LysR family transcriptional regulator [Selenomonas ruminantium subsp. lactilytica TAM6421]